MTVSSRSCAIIGNWKMHKSIAEAKSFVEKLLAHFDPQGKVIGLAVPFTSIYSLSELAKDSALLIGAQNMNEASEGAFTGEIAGTMLKDAGAKFVLLGHSERRHLYSETNEMINHKMKRAIECDLQPILCIGETFDEFNAKETHSVLERQLKEGLKDLSIEQLSQVILAYEPVWAIGNGHSATPEIAQEVHHYCRQLLAEMASEELARRTIIQYGGSVNSSNAAALLSQPDIDGLLIGGASLSLESFSQIINNSYSKNYSGAV
jgi:triosephosphate isomerase (TIM)